MSIETQLAILIVSLASIDALNAIADDRIWLTKAEINNKPAKLVFDTGANVNFLSPEALKRLGLKFIPAPTNDTALGVWAGDSELCKLSFNGIQGETTFLVLDLPSFAGADFDGGMGWMSLSQNLLKIDAILGKLTFSPEVPRKSKRWFQFSLSTNFQTLELRIPHGAGPEGILCIDTGTDIGVSLPKGAWANWKQAHPHSATTLKTAFSLISSRLEIHTEAWAEEISFGPLALTDVPISGEGPAIASVYGTNYEGTIGIAALKRMDFIVDGRNGKAYLLPKKSRARSYTHNRLGAVFLPNETHTNQFVSNVAAGSPAYEAGVRDGDILLQVDEIPCTYWSESWLSRFERPAGTKLKLMLEREGKTFTTRATLRDILHAGAGRR